MSISMWCNTTLNGRTRRPRYIILFRNFIVFTSLVLKWKYWFCKTILKVSVNFSLYKIYYKLLNLTEAQETWIDRLYEVLFYPLTYIGRLIIVSLKYFNTSHVRCRKSKCHFLFFWPKYTLFYVHYRFHIK